MTQQPPRASDGPRVSILEAIKIQARVLIPVMKALEAELGKERAHGIVRGAIAESYAGFVAARSAARNTHPGEGSGASETFPVETEEVENTPHAYGVNMVSCQFADYFRSIGEPEIGALMTCGVDFAVERAIRPEWRFERTQTRMQGAPFCDFRWRRRAAAGDGT